MSATQRILILGTGGIAARHAEHFSSIPLSVRIFSMARCVSPKTGPDQRNR